MIALGTYEALTANLSTHKALTANLIIDNCPLGTHFFVSLYELSQHMSYASCRLDRGMRSEATISVLRRGDARLAKRGNAQLHHSNISKLWHEMMQCGAILTRHST